MTGFLIVVGIAFDVFHTIIMPRLALQRARIAPLLIGQFLWPNFKRMLNLFPEHWRLGWLEVFAPLAFVMLLTTWLAGLITGFAFLFYSLGDYVKPPISDLADAFYFAGTSVLTLGFGDVVAAAWPARAIVLLAAVLGLIFMALVVSLLFSMLSYLQERESVVNTLVSRAGQPPSGVVLLMRYRELSILPSLSTSFVQWETWLASILESHRSFPLLMFFRSSSPDNSWLATVGATMDAASILLTSINDDWVGEADLYYWMGVSMLRAMAGSFNLEAVNEASMDKQQFITAMELLQQAGYSVRDSEKIWPYFMERRSGYMRYLIPLTERFDSPTHVWLPEFKSLG